jgi:hypothetical protein
MSPSERRTCVILPITTTIDYIDAPAFRTAVRPSMSRTSELGERGLFPANDAPDCRCPQISQLSTRSHKIQGKFKPDRPDGTPGPERYTPKPVLTRDPAYGLYGPKFRDEWLIDRKKTPPPNKYSPKQPIASTPMYTIGDRSRMEQKKFVPFGVGRFVVKLYEGVTVAQARRYLIKHPELTAVVDEIFGLVLPEKPEDPVGCLRAHFEGIREQVTTKRRPSDPYEQFMAICGDLEIDMK